MQATEIPLSLYVHIPWCVKKCPYCDFNSHEKRSALPEVRYVDALIADLKRQADGVAGRGIGSVYIGGGTPSLFSARSIERLLDAVARETGLAKDAEITVEANPGTFDQQNFAGFRSAGVNRISIGVQSFDDALLRALGRIHDANTARQAVLAAKQAHFENINIDVMYALPGQTLKQARRDVEQAIALTPSHISYYQLTLEPHTHFYRHPPTLPDGELGWAIQQQGTNLLMLHGWQQYEISAYAKDQFRCIHNMNYWRFGDYLGIGAGAHQKISSDKTGVWRSEKPRNPLQYMEQVLNDPLAGPACRPLSDDELVFEFLLNALRMKSGFTWQLFECNTGLSFGQLATKLQGLIQEGLIVRQDGGLRCSETGYRYLDGLLLRLLPEAPATPLGTQ
ncbi:MAG: radical SAM family heme chaperone HemW [Proteobacteria bacterium]|nr:radical SAM family heme chaperone HemW [Pseudomonadota bacterium]